VPGAGVSARRNQRDVAIVGGGVVGCTAALALAKLGLDVALIEAQPPPVWRADAPDLRVYAFAPDNAALLGGLGVWTRIVAARAQPYRHMRVWDAGGDGMLQLDADAFGRRELGWIVEHGLLVDRLSAALPAAGVRLHCPARVDALERDADGVRLRLDDGSRVEARIALAADGPQSSLRTLAGIAVQRHDYGQRGLVAYVETAQPHRDTAWQRFLPSGPLALLPCAAGGLEGRSGHVGSIVWTLPDAEAARLQALGEDAFDTALTRAFDAHLGDMRLRSRRADFPLRRQLAQQLHQDRVLVLGDAAHVVHPLAGQGVNLGLRDVAALRDSIAQAQARRADWSSPARLARWARARRSDNAVAAHAFDAINRVFSNDGVAATLLRGRLLGMGGRLPPLAHLLWRHASGC
jgi:2-octaprenyl-3-methyl-6-methoxy-1,4-benzoquinol hydroxylase